MAERQDLAVDEAARLLVGGPVDRIEPVVGPGRNSRIYRVICGSACYALKQYPAPAQDPRPRLRTEFDALSLMRENGIEVVPRALGCDPERGFALLSWVEGGPVTDPSAADIDATAEFLVQTHALRRAAGAERQPLGAEACLSGVEIVSQLGRRLAALAAPADDEPELAALLDRLSRYLFRTLLPRAVDGYAALGTSFARALPVERQTLCPSDFGFHNALRGGGGLVFLDFEYFGWDDPAKLCCDFLLHPGMNLEMELKQRFVAAVLPIFGGDPSFGRRLALMFPLLAMRWCLILLNEFLPSRWAGRVHAGAALDWAAAKRRQLSLATELLQSIEAHDGAFPFTAGGAR